jgi:hypothetical protein
MYIVYGVFVAVMETYITISIIRIMNDSIPKDGRKTLPSFSLKSYGASILLSQVDKLDLYLDTIFVL